MKAIHSLSISVVTAALLALSLPVQTFSQTMDMAQKEHEGRQGDRMEMGHMGKMGDMMEMGNMDRMGDMMGMCLEHADKMGLSDDQVMKMKPLHREMQKKQARFTADLKIAEIELMEIMDVKDFDLEKANSAVRKISEIKTNHQLEMLQAMKEMRSLFTEEQFKKMQNMMSMKADAKRHARRRSAKKQ